MTKEVQNQIAQGGDFIVQERYNEQTGGGEGAVKYARLTRVDGKPTELAKYITDNRRTGHTLLLTTEKDTVKGVIETAIGRNLSEAEYKNAEAALIQQGLASNGKIIAGKYTTVQDLRSSYHINRSISANLESISEGANRGTATLRLGGEIAEVITQIPGAAAGAVVTQVGSKVTTGEWASQKETFDGSVTGARVTNVFNLARAGVKAAAEFLARRAAAKAESTVVAAVASDIDDAAAAVNQVDDVAKNATSPAKAVNTSSSGSGNAPPGSSGNSPSGGGGTSGPPSSGGNPSGAGGSSGGGAPPGGGGTPPSDPWDDFIDEAISRAEDAGYRPADFQDNVKWDKVAEWTTKVQNPDFQWKSSAELAQIPGADIIVAPDGGGWNSILNGQHRILGGLMGGNPVPQTSIDLKPWQYPSKPWSK